MKKRQYKGKPGKSFGRTAIKTHKFNMPQLKPMRGGIRL